MVNSLEANFIFQAEDKYNSIHPHGKLQNKNGKGILWEKQWWGKIETFLPYLEGNTHQRNLLSDNNQGLKVAYISKMMNLITLQVMGIWDTKRFFPTLTTASLLRWYMILQGQLLSVHIGFDAQRKKTSQPHISEFVNFKWITLISMHLRAPLSVLFPHPVIYMHTCTLMFLLMPGRVLELRFYKHC